MITLKLYFEVSLNEYSIRFDIMYKKKLIYDKSLPQYFSIMSEKKARILKSHVHTYTIHINKYLLTVAP